MNRERWLIVVAIASGVLAWIVVTGVSGRREAWDSGLYWVIAVPFVCIVSAICGRLEPAHPLRWGVLPQVGQFGWLLLTQGPGNLLPLGVIAFAVMSVPSILAAKVGARRSRFRNGSSPG